MNNVVLAGNVAGDIKLNEGGTVASFQISTRGYDGVKKEAVRDYHNVTLFGKSATRAGELLAKGSSVEVSGELKTDSWEKDGVKKYKTYVKTFNFGFGSKNFAEENTAEVVPF